MVRTSLAICAETPEGNDNGVDYYADNRDPHVHDKEDDLDKQNEHRQNRNDNVVVGDAREQSAFEFTCSRQSTLTNQTKLEVSLVSADSLRMRTRSVPDSN